MITSFIFSLLAFFIVTTTSIFVIKNKSKVNNIDKNVKVTQLNFEKDKYMNQKKVQNLVNDINLNNNKLENNINNTKKEVKFENKKTNENVKNLDKRFNSYKNITTANFMGINNRMTDENKRLNDNILDNKAKMRDNRIAQQAMNVNLTSSINNNKSKFTQFIKDAFTPTIDKLKLDNINQNSNILDFQDSLMKTIQVSSNLSDDSRDIIQNYGINTRRTINNSLTNFFNTNEESDVNFISSYMGASGSNLHRDWFDRYYNIESHSNFNTFDDMLIKADENMNLVKDEKIRLNSLYQTVNTHETRLDPRSNLYKTNLNEFVKNEFNFNLKDLVTISNNTNQISSLKQDISSLSNSLEQIGIFDVATGGSITLGDLNNSIVANQDLITNNQIKNDNMFDSKFDSYLGSNLSSYYNTITDNLDSNKLTERLTNTDLYLRDITSSNITTNELDLIGDLRVSGGFQIGDIDYKDVIDKNTNEIIKYSDVFNSEGIEYESGFSIGGGDSELLRKKPLMYFTSKKDLAIGNIINKNDEDLGSKISLAPSVDIELSRGDYDDEYKKQVGGKLFVDSFFDIGVPDMGEYGPILDVGKRKQFKQGESLGDRLDSLSNSIQETKDNIVSGGVTKSSLFDMINGDNVEYNLKIQGNGISEKSDHFRINDLYTGSKPIYGCRADGDNGKCKSVDKRLTFLEDRQFAQDGLSDDNELFNNNIDTYGIRKNKETPTAKKSLSITNLKIDGDLEIGENNANNSKLRLRNSDDILYRMDNTYIPFEDKFVKTGDPHVQSITANTDTNNNVTGFSYIDGTNTTNSIIFPTSSHVIDDDNIKSAVIVNGLLAHSKNISLTDYNGTPSSIHIPQSYIHNVQLDDNKLIFNKIVPGRLDSMMEETLSISLNTPSRSEILTQLNTVSVDVELLPDFEKGIKFGSEGSIKMSNGTLIACTNTGDCKPIWDHRAAPDPIMTTSTSSS